MNSQTKREDLVRLVIFLITVLSIAYIALFQ